MRERPKPRPIPPSPFRLVHWPAPDSDKYRTLFRRVGGPWLWFSRLVMEEARLRGKIHPVGATGLLRLRDVGDVPVEVIAQTVDGNRVRLAPTAPQREALMIRFYAEGAAPGTGRAQLAGLLAGLGQRFTFSARR